MEGRRRRDSSKNVIHVFEVPMNDTRIQCCCFDHSQSKSQY